MHFSTDQKRKRGPEFSDVEKCVVNNIKKSRNANVIIGEGTLFSEMNTSVRKNIKPLNI